MTKLINLTDLAKGTWSLYQKKFVVLVSLMALPFLLFIVSPLLAQTFDYLYLPLFIVLILVACFLLIWTGTAVIVVLHNHQDNLTVKESLVRSKNKIWPVIWVALIVCFITCGASIFFFVPGLILAFYFVFAKLIVIVEEEQGMRALIKSREYLRGYFWPIVGRYLAIVLVSFVAYFILGLVSSFLGQTFISTLGVRAGTAILLVLQALVNILIFPLMMIPAYLLYVDVKKVRGDIVVNLKNKQGLIYLAIGLAGWIFLGVMIALATIVFTSAIGGYLIGAFASDIFNGQVPLK